MSILILAKSILGNTEYYVGIVPCVQNVDQLEKLYAPAPSLNQIRPGNDN